MNDIEATKKAMRKSKDTFHISLSSEDRYKLLKELSFVYYSLDIKSTPEFKKKFPLLCEFERSLIEA